MGYLFLDQKKVPRSRRVKVLGVEVADDLTSEAHISARIAAAWKAFWAERASRRICVQNRLNYLRTIINPVAVYGVDRTQ